MDQQNKAFLPLLLLFQLVLLGAALNSNEDFIALKSLSEFLENTPASWAGRDPCADRWEGIKCTNSRVTSMTLQSMNIGGRLSDDILSLSELQTLDLSYNKDLTGPIPDEIGNLTNLQTLILVGCSFSGPIPDSIGSLKQLTFLALNLNQFTGKVPRTLGSLSKIDWLDIADNQIEGSIPVSDDEGPGLDMLLTAQHFHFGNNKLSGEIPAQLFSSNMKLKHLLLHNNQLNGSIPDTVGLVKTLDLIRLDRNQLSGEVPSNISNLTELSKLYLSNNKLTGPMPDLTPLSGLHYVELSNNTFDSAGIPSWASNLPFLTTLQLEKTGLQGEVPVSLFNQPNLETVEMRNNQLNGTLDIGNANSDRLQLIDLENNQITDFTQKNADTKIRVILVGNSMCLETGATSESYCKKNESSVSFPYSTATNNCQPLLCSSYQLSSPNCKCAHPYTGILISRAASFSNLENTSYYKVLEQTLMAAFRSQNLPVDSISLSNPFKNSSTDYFQLNLNVFPSGSDHFNLTGVSSIAFVLSKQIYEPPEFFIPYFFKGDKYGYYSGESSSSKSHTGFIVGALVAVLVLLVVSILAGTYAIRQKKRARKSKDSNPFANWEENKNSGSAPQLKGARWFSFDELKKYSNNFSEANTIGAGGYGKVYQGVLPSGELVAIKRAAQESLQGAIEFKTEIELLSRVHHKNLVGLVGFCFEKGEQMLVYEYIPNGSVMASLSGRSGIRMDWMRRLKVAVGAARGLAYLHELANPPIIHRDIKSSNILLDHYLNAKVADFGLSKLIDSDRGYIITQVKGTMGYLDPEYYMTQLLTEKSDVYSFGVLILELVTGRKPIERGKFIVREVLRVMDRSKELYNLDVILDPTITKEKAQKGLEKFVDLALRCVKENAAERPTMAEVVKEIENIMELAGLNPTADSETTSATYEGAGSGKVHHPYSDEDFAYTGDFPSV